MSNDRLQKDLEEMSDFLVIKSTEEQRAEGVESPVDTAYIDDRDGLPILKAVFDIHHFQPDDVTITVENTSGEETDSGAQRQLVLFAQLTDDSRECSLFKKVCVASTEFCFVLSIRVITRLLTHELVFVDHLYDVYLLIQLSFIMELLGVHYLVHMSVGLPLCLIPAVTKNDLPEDVTSATESLTTFRRLLKTHLLVFRKSFPDY